MIHTGLRTLLLAGVLALTGISAGPSPADAAEPSPIGYFDLTRVVAAHPLTGKFDPRTCRFSGTTSQPPEDLDLAIKRSELAVRAISLRLDQLKSRLELAMKAGGRAASDALQSYWLKRKPIEAELVVEQSRLTEYEEMRSLGRSTKNESVAPVLDKILTDIRDAIGEVAAKTGVQVIMDVSAINRRQAAHEIMADLSTVQENPLRRLWETPGPVVSADSLECWLDAAGELVVRRIPALGCPVPAGGLDLEPDILRLLNPKLAAPGVTPDRSHR